MGNHRAATFPLTAVVLMALVHAAPDRQASTPQAPPAQAAAGRPAGAKPAAPAVTALTDAAGPAT
jgi:hypothetical protein